MQGAHGVRPARPDFCIFFEFSPAEFLFEFGKSLGGRFARKYAKKRIF